MRARVNMVLILLLAVLAVEVASTTEPNRLTVVGVVEVGELRVFAVYDDSCSCWRRPGRGLVPPMPLHGPVARVRLSISRRLAGA